MVTNLTLSPLPLMADVQREIAMLRNKLELRLGEFQRVNVALDNEVVVRKRAELAATDAANAKAAFLATVCSCLVNS